MNLNRRGALGAMTSVVLACSLQGGVDDPGVGNARLPLQGGTFDSGDLYPQVTVQGPVAAADNGVNGCSGILISDRHVLASMHCFYAQTGRDGRTQNVLVELRRQSGNTRFRHTYALGRKPVILRPPLGTGGELFVAQDLAVYRLDTAVPRALATPMNLAGFRGMPTCPTTATFVDVGDGPLSPTGPRPGRNFATIGPWQLLTPNNGTAQDAFWKYTGSLTSGPIFGGDSGGPGIWTSSQGPIVCSVHSNTTQSASIQSASNLAWLNGPETDLLDGSGKFKGACGPDDVVTATNDPDGDGIPTRCDNSPQPNPDQGDRDGDGTPDVDDNCPYDANDQTNSNSEEEQRLGLPARGDVCDPNPLTLAALTPCDPNPASGFGCGDSRADGAVRTTSVPVRQVPVSACGGPDALTWDVANGNRFDGTSFVGGKYVDQFARTRVLRCQCDDTMTDDECRRLVGCDRGTPASPATRWRSTTVTEGGTTITDAATSLIPTFHPDLTRGGRLPDSRNLAWAYWKDPDITVPGTPSRVTVEVWQGLAWAWVKDWDAIVYPTPSGPVRDPATAALRQSTRTVARMHVRESTPLLGGIRYCSPVDRNFGRIPTRIRPDWWNGGDVLVDIGTTETNPTDTWGAHVGGLPDTSAEKLLDAWTAKAFRDPKLTFLAPTDAPRWWGAGYAGAVVDVNASRVASRVRFAGTSLEAEREPVDAGKPFTYLLVAALSGRRQEVAFFSDRTSGDVVQAARVYNLATGSSSSRPYDVTGQSEVLKNPVAATYRAEDDAYYVLDKVDVMRLLRVVPKVHVETVATWPLGSVYTTGYGLTTGADGSLVVTSSAAGDPKHCVATIALSDVGAATGGRRLTGNTFAQTSASLGADLRISMAVRDASGGKTFLSRRLTDGSAVDLAGVGQCF